MYLCAKIDVAVKNYSSSCFIFVKHPFRTNEIVCPYFLIFNMILVESN